MIRVVVDPGVLISAIIAPEGASSDVLRAAREGRIDIVASETLLGELRAVLRRPKFRRYATEAQVDRYVALLRRIGRWVEDPPLRAGLTRDPKDDYLVALAGAAGAAVVIVSGDADLLEAENIGRPVLTPRALLDALERD